MPEIRTPGRPRQLAGFAAALAVLVFFLAGVLAPAAGNTATVGPETEPGGSITADDTATTTTTEPVSEVTVPTGVVSTTGGDLVWGVRSSFINYIKTPFVDGTITVEGGAVDNTEGDGTFTFPGVPGGSFDGTTDDTDASFAGAVRFTGHDHGSGPELDLRIEHLNILRDETGSWLVGDVSTLPFEGTSGGTGGPKPPELFPDLKLVSLDTERVLPVSTPPDGLTWNDLATTLTEDAVPAFGFYAAGEPMDPVTYTLTFDDVPDVPVDPIGPVTPVVTLDKTAVNAGESLTASGPGFQAGEQVEVWLHSTPTWVTSTVADATGLVTVTFVVPVETPAGVHQIELRGISSGTSITSSDFTVVAASVTPTGGTLPETGADGRIAVAGTVMLAVGVALVALARRRDIAATGH